LKNDFLAAEKRCLMLKKKMPENSEVNLLFADFLLLRNQPGKAEEFYRKALLLSSDSPVLFLKFSICLKAMGKNVEADKFFQIADKKSVNKTPLILLKMADYFLLSDNYEKAEQSILQAVKQEPEDLSLQKRLAEFYFSTDRLEKAEKFLTRLVDSVPQSVYLKKMLADTYISLNKLELAEKMITTLGNFLNDENPEYELLKGKYWFHKSNFVYAATHLESAVALIPGSSSAHYFLGIAYLAAGRNQLAENSLKKAVFTNPQNVKAALLIADIQYKKNRYDLSLAYLNQILESEPENYRGHMLKGINLIALKKYDSAAIEFGTALKISSVSCDPLYFLALTAELSGKDDIAMEYYNKILSIHPDLADASYRYVMLLFRTKEFKKADEFVLHNIEKNPENPYSYYTAGMLFLRDKKLDQAKEYFTKAILNFNKPEPAYLKLASIQEQQGDINKAVATLEMCVKKNPYYTYGWLDLAQLYLKNGMAVKALDIMKKAEKIIPDSPRILANLAWLYIENNSDLDLAFEFARRAYKKMPQDSSIADTLGWAYYKKGLYAQAVWILSEAEQKAPANGMILYHLGMALYSQGKMVQAKDKMQKALKYNLPESCIREINQRVMDSKPRHDSCEFLKSDLFEIDKTSPFSVNGQGEDHCDDSLQIRIPKSRILELQEEQEYSDEGILQPQWQNNE
ncbi:MAG: tetratricopeptide repeat protein, partial [Thermodesulfobacteriota bacterium]|nr:tetratricopeptide repeat protein [Thermodesulfobacteriota bacterium]